MQRESEKGRPRESSAEQSAWAFGRALGYRQLPPAAPKVRKYLNSTRASSWGPASVSPPDRPLCDPRRSYSSWMWLLPSSVPTPSLAPGSPGCPIRQEVSCKAGLGPPISLALLPSSHFLPTSSLNTYCAPGRSPGPRDSGVTQTDPVPVVELISRVWKSRGQGIFVDLSCSQRSML